MQIGKYLSENEHVVDSVPTVADIEAPTPVSVDAEVESEVTV